VRQSQQGQFLISKVHLGFTKNALKLHIAQAGLLIGLVLITVCSGWLAGINMTIYFSKQKNGFYDTELHGGSIPTDKVEISFQQYQDLIDAQTLGKEISSDDNGMPILLDRKKASYDKLRAAEYPPIFDYIDGVVKGDQSQINAYIQACIAVKAKYPKE